MATTFNTPLRYPGGKSKLSGFVQSVLKANSLSDVHYVETYAGGAGIAFELLFLEHAAHVHLNDLDRAVFSFWDAVVNHAEWMCKKITDTPLTVDVWKQQRSIYQDVENADPLELGFAFFYLNRTNRSGILNGGVIGGLDQSGEWKIDARYNKLNLVQRIEKIALYRSRISIYNLDAGNFILSELPKLPDKTLVYLDPPYFLKGGDLYENHYKEKDHLGIAEIIQSEIKHRWIVSYDNVPDITKLYRQRRRVTYNLNYSAAKAAVGSEAMFFCDQLNLPESLSEGMRLYRPRKTTPKNPKIIARQKFSKIKLPASRRGRELSKKGDH